MASYTFRFYTHTHRDTHTHMHIYLDNSQKNNYTLVGLISETHFSSIFLCIFSSLKWLVQHLSLIKISVKINLIEEIPNGIVFTKGYTKPSTNSLNLYFHENENPSFQRPNNFV